MNYAVIGTGAIGGYYGGRLAFAGNDVHFLYHTEYDYVREHGLTVNSCNGDFHLTKMNLYKSVADMPKCDVVLVALKTTMNGRLAQMIAPILKEESLVILIQNGIFFEERLAQELKATHIDVAIGGGLAFICSSRTGMGEITHYDYGRLTLGMMKGHFSPLFKWVIEDFVQSRIEIVEARNLLEARWKKLVWNIPFNSLSVIEMKNTGELLASEEQIRYVKSIMLEVIRAAEANGVYIPESFADEMIQSTLDMKPYLPSMRLDYDAHRALEIEGILRNPIEAGKRCGYDMPLVSDLLKKLEMKSM